MADDRDETEENRYQIIAIENAMTISWKISICWTFKHLDDLRANLNASIDASMLTMYAD